MTTRATGGLRGGCPHVLFEQIRCLELFCECLGFGSTAFVVVLVDVCALLEEPLADPKVAIHACPVHACVAELVALGDIFGRAMVV